VVDSVPVGLPRPRDFGSPEFAALEKRLLDLLIGEDSGADIAV
jgi:hypothetical protein